MVFDTMVLAYALLKVSAFREEAARAIEVAEAIWVPDSFRAELTNVVWQWTSERGTDLDSGLSVLRDAEALISEVFPGNMLWEEALALSIARRHPAYDTLFIALAAIQSSKVVTYDAQLRKKFPEYTISAREFIG